MKTICEQLEMIIVEHYGSVVAFANELEIPPTTLYSMLKRNDDLKGAKISIVISIFDALNLDVESISTGELRKKEAPLEVSASEKLDEILSVFLKENGYIKDNNDISDADLRFLKTWFSALDAWFDNRLH